jgi:hypothetical protein
MICLYRCSPGTGTTQSTLFSWICIAGSSVMLAKALRKSIMGQRTHSRSGSFAAPGESARQTLCHAVGMWKQDRFQETRRVMESPQLRQRQQLRENGAAYVIVIGHLNSHDAKPGDLFRRHSSFCFNSTSVLVAARQAVSLDWQQNTCQ